MDQGDAQDLLNLIRTDLGLDQAKSRFPQKSTLLTIYSRAVNTGQPLGKILASHFPWCADRLAEIKQLLKDYGERKAERNLLDYDDLLLYWEQAVETPLVVPAIADRFRHLLIDEYQDTNPLQASILRKLWALMIRGQTAGPARSIMVVGDDAQAIYAFRGATVENILQFPEEFVGTTTVALEQNYRSVQPILDASNAVMSLAKRRFTKNLWSERPGDQRPQLVTCADELAQSTFLADRILAHREEGVSLMKQAVLFRASHNSDALEVELGRRNIPFVKWGGLKFLEAAHIKDLLAFLRILENPDDDLSWMRILQMLDGVGPGRARQAVAHFRQHRAEPRPLLTWNAPASARAAWKAWRSSWTSWETRSRSCLCRPRSSASASSIRRSSRNAMRARRCGCATSTSWNCLPSRPAAAPPSSPTSRSTRPPRQATWQAHRSWMRSMWSSPPFTRPKAASGTWSTSSTPRTASCRRTWFKATRSWKKSAGCSTSP